LRDEDYGASEPANCSDKAEAKGYLTNRVSLVSSNRKEGEKFAAGLNIPPLTLKNTQTLTHKLKPKAKDIYNRIPALGRSLWDDSSTEIIFAT
jgi:hypothetical protein